jgi:hypothetical protein
VELRKTAFGMLFAEGRSVVNANSRRGAVPLDRGRRPPSAFLTRVLVEPDQGVRRGRGRPPHCRVVICYIEIVMEASARRRFQKIEATLASVARQQAAAEVRARKYDERLRRIDAQSRIRDRRIEAELKARDDRFDKRLRRLMESGMKLIAKSEERQASSLAEITEKLDALISVVDGIIRRPSPPPA